MPNLSLRDIPEQVHRDLKAAANRNHRSLNGEILARLSASVGPEAQEVDLEALLERIQQRHETIVRGHDETAEMATNENRDPVNAETRFKYDVCLSFAGEQREFVEQVAAKLKAHGIRVFFDDDEQVALWGKDLYAYLDDVYRHLCRYCIIFASKEYAAKMWTTHERQSAQARALRENREYILPARFDDTPIPGLLDTLHYIDLRETPPEELAPLAITKLGSPQRWQYVPPVADLLFERCGVDDVATQASIQSTAWSFMNVLRRMNSEERVAVISFLRFGCPADLPDNVHIHTDLLSRTTDLPVAALTRLLAGIRSLGFSCTIRASLEDEEDECLRGTVLGDSYFFELDWVDLSDDRFEFPALAVASEMIASVTEQYCEGCGTRALERLDFSQIASATATLENTH